MAHIQIVLNHAEDKILAAAARREGRTKRSQLKVSAIEHAKGLISRPRKGARR